MEDPGNVTPESSTANGLAKTPSQPAIESSAPLVGKSPLIRSIERVTVWVMVLSTIALALISILAIWGVFDNTGDVVGRSVGTIAVVAFAALVVNVGANALDRSKKK